MNKETVNAMIENAFHNIEAAKSMVEAAKKAERKRKIINAIGMFIEYSVAIIMLIMFLAVLFLIAYKFGIVLTWIN